MSLTMTIDEIDLSDLDFWGLPFDERDEAFRALREQRPVAFFAEPRLPLLPPGPGFWAITRLADVVAVSRDPKTFSSAQGSVLPDLPPGAPFSYLRSMIDLDNPRHGEMRQLVASAFTPSMVSRLRGQVETLCDEIVDGVIERGECDLAAEIATPLPIALVCQLLGVPRSDWEWVRQRAALAYGRDDPEFVPGVLEEPDRGGLAVLAAVQEMAEYMTALSAEKRTCPSDDLTSRLVSAQLNGRPLSDEQLAQWFVLLTVAGAETTRQAISHGVLMLDRHPEQRAAWQRDFDGVSRTAVEELVRWSSPVISFRRTVTRDTTLGGQELQAGEKVMLFYPSANRDERGFDDPYRFDLLRSPNRHVGYGGPGPHFCLGAHLARREIAAMFKVLFERLVNLEVTGEPQWLRSTSINGIKHLPVRFSAAQVRG